MSPFLVTLEDGVELGVETFGDPSHPTVLLLAGATSSMDWWEVGWCERLADERLHVVRYDHRDTGASTSWPAGEPGYAGRDLTRDPVRLLDALGVGSAHLVGVSMGGGIAQDVAMHDPVRVRSLTLVSTTCAFERSSPDSLPGPRPRVRALFEDPPADPDWADPEAVAEHLVAAQRAFSGSLGLDEEAVLATARTIVARTRDVRASLTNHWQVVGEEDGPPRSMRELGVPTLVVHGSDDPFFPVEHGQALAAEVAGARLVVVPGMGHEHPPRATWDQVVPEVVALVRQVEGARLSPPRPRG